MALMTKAITIGAFSLMGMGAYSASSTGVGADKIKDTNAVNEIKRNCPDYYKTKDGQCLRKNFRSGYVMWYRGSRRTSGGGGRSGGK